MNPLHVVLTSSSVTIRVLWDVTPWSLGRKVASSCLHLQDSLYLCGKNQTKQWSFCMKMRMRCCMYLAQRVLQPSAVSNKSRREKWNIYLTLNIRALSFWYGVILYYSRSFLGLSFWNRKQQNRTAYRIWKCNRKCYIFKIFELHFHIP
jgi:hypothetical protein